MIEVPSTFTNYASCCPRGGKLLGLGEFSR